MERDIVSVTMKDGISFDVNRQKLARNLRISQDVARLAGLRPGEPIIDRPAPRDIPSWDAMAVYVTCFQSLE